MVSRSFVRAVREDTLRGSEGHATFAAIEKSKLEEAFGEAARGYASATSLWLARLDGVVGDQSTIVVGVKVDMHRLLCLWLQHRIEKQTHPALSRPTALGSPSADLIGSVIDTEARIQVPFLRRELQAAASLTQSVGQAVTFDHCEPIARATQLTGEVLAVSQRQCFRAADCRTGRNLGGVMVPGTAAKHVVKFMSQLGEHSNYREVCVDDAGMSNWLYQQTLGVPPALVYQGTGHLLRRVFKTFHEACQFKKTACKDFGRIMTSYDTDVDDGLILGLITPGGLPCGSRVQIVAAVKAAGTKTVVKT